MQGMRGSGGPGDDELVRWLADGYAPAFRTAMLILHNRSDAEEAVQDAFLRAWRFRTAVPDGAGVKPWLYRVVVNAALSKLRADGNRRTRTVSLDDQVKPSALRPRAAPAQPEDWVVGRERQQVVLDAMAGLPDHLRVVVALRYYAQLSEKEIAEVIHRRPGTVKSRLHEARRLLGTDPRLAAVAAPDLIEERGQA
jgi:RNA polymerase sigma-70 factor (ECF subfamily)